MTNDRGLHLCAAIYNHLTRLGKAMDYEEGGATVKFASLSDVQDMMKFASKVCKATTFLTGNALQ